MFKLCNSQMEALIVLNTIEEAREKITELKAAGNYSFYIYETETEPKRWVETEEAKKLREDAHTAYLQKHSVFLEMRDKSRMTKTDYDDRDDAVKDFYSL